MVRAILTDRRFVTTPPAPPAPTWFDAFRRWLGALLRPLLHVVDRALGQTNGFNVVIGTAVIFAACALLGFAVFRLVRSLASRARPARRPAPLAGALSLTGTDAAGLRAAALEAASAGRYRDAAALLFTAAARALDETGQLAYDAARTPGEYRRLLHDPSFDALSTEAVVALFAAAEPRPDVFERMTAAYDRLFAGRLAR